MDSERQLKERFVKYHQFYRLSCDLNVTKLARELGISRMKFYRWLKDKSHLNEIQLAHIKKLLTNSNFILIILVTMVDIIYQGLPRRTATIGKFFKNAVDFMLTAIFYFSNRLTAKVKQNLNLYDWVFFVM